MQSDRTLHCGLPLKKLPCAAVSIDHRTLPRIVRFTICHCRDQEQLEKRAVQKMTGTEDRKFTGVELLPYLTLPLLPLWFWN